MTCGIYKIKNNINGKMYIGQSVGIEARWKQHTRASKTSDTHLYKSIRKYGIDNFSFTVICEVPENVLDEYEISYIKYYETTNPSKGYNLMSGGSNGRHSEETKKKLSDSNKGKIYSEETKKKISDAKKGKTHSEETKKKMSTAQKGKTRNLGRTCSSETKKKLSDSNKGKTHSEETKKKLSDSNKGKIYSEETKKKMSAAKKNMTEETKKKMSAAQKGKTYSDEHKKKMSESSKKQYQYQGNVYNGKQELADFLGRFRKV